MSKTPELLPCPFCGSDDIELIFGDDDRYSADCGNCAATGPAENNPDAAIAEWNTRVYPPEIQSAVDRDTPKKPHEEHRSREHVEHGNTAIYRCSSCKVDLLVGFHFCPDCGQRLDWSE